MPISPIPEHRCSVLMMYNDEEEMTVSIRCRVCNREVMWCDLYAVGGRIDFRFPGIPTEPIRDSKAMYYSMEEKQRLR
jgi:hypothetical protein